LPARVEAGKPESFSIYLYCMADVHNKKTRSYNMSQIKATNTKPELLVRKFLHANGYRYSLHKKILAGKPDIVLPKYKTIIFIHGCFWHGHANCKYFVVPKTRTKWWLNKIAANKANDEKAVKALKKEGWKVITVWECKLKPAKAEKTLTSLLQKI
jgi:DNA mismatch endonuclease (patch repair protein)